MAYAVSVDCIESGGSGNKYTATRGSPPNPSRHR
jgi:hypothetical protein